MICKLIKQKFIQFVVHIYILFQYQGFNYTRGFFINESFRLNRVDCAEVSILLMRFFIPLLSKRSCWCVKKPLWVRVHNLLTIRPRCKHFINNSSFKSLKISVILVEHKRSYHSFISNSDQINDSLFHFIYSKILSMLWC